jgi:prepilin signal peptidase PulO-like enzyme (type II secretory pathway)
VTYDINTRVSNNQVLAGGGLAPSTNSILIIGNLGTPLSLAGRDVGAGEGLVFRVFITQAFDGTVASLIVNTVVSANSDLSAPTLTGATTVTASGLFLGNEFDVRIPTLSEYNAAGSFYLGLYYTPSAVPVTGAVSAWIPLGESPNRQRRLTGNYTGP